MKIAITSQNFRTITGHAGKARRFLIFQQGETGRPTEVDRLDLPKEMSIHEFQGDTHPVFVADVLITGGCGLGFIHRMAAHDVQVLTTSESDPVRAADLVFSGERLPAAQPHEHAHPEPAGGVSIR